MSIPKFQLTILCLILFGSQLFAQPERMLLMHSPMGIRVEYNIDQQNIELWLSPQAKESVDQFDRNFSNRDDHSRLFDCIELPTLLPKDFQYIDYHPYHSIVYFKTDTLHVRVLFDHPAVILSSNQGLQVVLKSDKADKVAKRHEKMFSLIHPDRGYQFNYLAAMGKGAGKFTHQLQLGRGRSTYAQANLAAKQSLYILGELQQENVPAIYKQLSQQAAKHWTKESIATAEARAQYGRLVLRNQPELQKLLDLNRLIWTSVQDHSGAMRASIKRIYYLIWVREGGLACPFIAYSGWVFPLNSWTDFMMHNPTVITDEEPPGRFFGQLVAPKINKWEEDGLFYAVWSAFALWTQTGDSTYISGKHLALLEEANQWLEDYCFDPEMGLFGRYHYCETPLKNSRGYHWDNAVGKPTGFWEPEPYQGKNIVRSYDSYINLLAYNTYLMLSAMTSNEKARQYFDKAKALEKAMKPFFPKNTEMPHYGLLITEDGQHIMAPEYGMDKTDYLWGLTLPHFLPEYIDPYPIKANLLDTLIQSPEKQFLAGYFSVLASLDVAQYDEKRMMQTVEYAAKQCYKPGKYLPMAYSMIEMTDMPDGDPYHDIRPQSFTIGSWLGAMSNFALRRYAFGVAVRPTNYVQSIEKYQFKNSQIDFKFEGEGPTISSISINGNKLKNCWQIPEQWLKKGENTIEVNMGNRAPSEPLLAGGNILLINTFSKRKSLFYQIETFGINSLEFLKAPDNLLILTSKGKEVVYSRSQQGKFEVIRFEGRGRYTVQIDL